LTIAFEFDGVCTDLSFIREKQISELDYLYSPFSLTISKPRNGILEILSIFGLFSDLAIISSRPVEDESYIKNWLSHNKLLSFFEKILCCGEFAKTEIMAQNGINVLIGVKTIHVISQSGNLKIILWNEQTWIEFAIELFTFLMSISKACIKIKPDLKLCEVEYLSDLGSSPVFLLKFTDRTKLKLRICLNYEVKYRVTTFLEIAVKNDYKHVSRLVAENGLAILKLYIEGKLISTFGKRERLYYVFKAGSALAKLHSIKINKPISNFTFGINDGSDSLLVLSADNYNMIITTENDVSFIDLEACNSGSRWIDLVWSDNLLCENERERKALIEGYFSIYKGNIATEEEMKMAKHNYKLWLTYQLQNSRLIHSRDTQKNKIISDTFLQIWND